MNKRAKAELHEGRVSREFDYADYRVLHKEHTAALVAKMKAALTRCPYARCTYSKQLEGLPHTPVRLIDKDVDTFVVVSDWFDKWYGMEMPSFLEGLGRTIDIGATAGGQVDLSANPWEADAEALASDWTVAAADLRCALDLVQKRNALVHGQWTKHTHKTSEPDAVGGVRKDAPKPYTPAKESGR